MTEFYGYKHWTLEESPRCFYVGKGHVKRPCQKQGRNHKWHAVVGRFGLRVEVCIGPVTNEEARAWEVEQIAQEGTFSGCHDHDFEDVGCNFTRGGDGITGWKHTDVTRKKMSTSHTGVPLPRAVCDAISAAQKGKVKSDEHRRRLSDSNLGKNTGKMAGEKHHATKLRDDVVIEVRKLWLTTGATRDELCEKYDLNAGVLSGILNGRTFKHLLDDVTLQGLRGLCRKSTTA